MLHVKLFKVTSRLSLQAAHLKEGNFRNTKVSKSSRITFGMRERKKEILSRVASETNVLN
jgi:hypothetical protein